LFHSNALPQVNLLVPAVGLEHIFDEWTKTETFGGWQVRVPTVAGLDAEKVVRSYYSDLVSAVSGTYLRIVAAGDAAHLCVDLLSNAVDGRCALIDPPVALLLPIEEQDDILESGVNIISDMEALRGPLEEVDIASKLDYSEDDRLRVLISALEESDLPGDEQTRGEIRAMLRSYRKSIEEGASQEVVNLDPWWVTVENSPHRNRIEAWFSGNRHLPNSLPIHSHKTTWRSDWWHSSSEEVAREVATFLQ
jgi:hypothetical protein